MIKLTNTQVAVLASACQHEDGLATCPTSLRPSAAAKVTARLIELGLVREVRAKGDAPVWREDEQGRALGLKILKAGRAAMLAEAAATRLAQAEADASVPQDTGSEAGASCADDAEQYCYRVQVRPIRAQAQSLCFQRNRAASGKRIIDWRPLGLKIVEDAEPVALRRRLLAQPPSNRARNLPPRCV